MAGALRAFDEALPSIRAAMRREDLLLITADHGHDPTDASTDHSREYVPLLVVNPSGRSNVRLGDRTTFADLGRTVADFFGVPAGSIAGTSFLASLR